MSEDLIKRSDAAEVVYKALKTPPLKGVLTDTMSLAIALVRAVPSADRPQGKWIVFDEESNTYGCTNCGEPWTLMEGYPSENNMNFCPNCGARMKGADDE